MRNERIILKPDNQINSRSDWSVSYGLLYQ